MQILLNNQPGRLTLSSLQTLSERPTREKYSFEIQIASSAVQGNAKKAQSVQLKDSKRWIAAALRSLDYPLHNKN